MKIGTNYNAPVFCASFAKDKETKSILKNATKESEYSYTPVYETVEDLRNLKAQDTISISKPNEYTYVVKNNNTGALATISRTNESDLYFYNDWTEGVEYLSTAIRGVLFDEGNHEYMFSDTKKINNIEPSYHEKQAAIARKSKTQKLVRRIGILNRQYVKAIQRLIDDEAKIKEIKSLKEELEEKKRSQERAYTLTLIG